MRRNPVFIDSAITSVATPAAIPMTENKRYQAQHGRLIGRPQIPARNQPGKPHFWSPELGSENVR